MLTTEAMRLFMTSRKARGLSKETLRWYNGILTPFAGRFPELPHDPESLEVYISCCEAGDERRHGYYRVLKAFYRFLNKRHGVVNPVDLIDPPKRRPKLPRPLSPKELVDLLRYPHSPRIKAYLLFVTDTGCRLGELHNLAHSSFHETSFGMTVTLTGKTGERTIPVSKEVYTGIQEYIPIPCSSWWLCRQLSGAFKDARISGTCHSLRHTFCTLWDGPEMTLQRIVGHTHFTTTEGYRAVRMEKMAREHRQYSPLAQISRQSIGFLTDQ